MEKIPPTQRHSSAHSSHQAASPLSASAPLPSSSSPASASPDDEKGSRDPGEEEEIEDEQRAEFVRAVNALAKCRRSTRFGEISLQFQGRRLTALIDTGSDRSIISHRLYREILCSKRHRFKRPLRKSLTRLFSATSHRLDVAGSIDASMVVGGKQVSYEFLVTHNPSDEIILGLDFLTAMGAEMSFPNKTLRLARVGATVRLGHLGEENPRYIPLYAVRAVKIQSAYERLVDVMTDGVEDTLSACGYVRPCEWGEEVRSYVPSRGYTTLHVGHTVVPVANLTMEETEIKEGECVALLLHSPGEEVKVRRLEEDLPAVERGVVKAKNASVSKTSKHATRCSSHRPARLRIPQAGDEVSTTCTAEIRTSMAIPDGRSPSMGHPSEAVRLPTKGRSTRNHHGRGSNPEPAPCEVRVLTTETEPTEEEQGVVITDPAVRQQVLNDDTETQPDEMMMCPEDPHPFDEKDVHTGAISESQRQRLVKLLKEFPDTTSGPIVAMRTTLPEFQIKVPESQRPIVAHPYRSSYKERERLKEEIDKMLALGVIQESHSPWSSPTVMVRKKDGEIRFCVDYRRLNEVTERDVYPIPRIDDTLAQLGQMQYFTCIDLRSAYWQAPIAESSKKYTAFVSEHGLFEFNAIPFGLTNAPAAFQRIMDVVLAGLKFKSVLCYLDDIIIYSPTFEDHLRDLRDVLLRLKQHELVLKLPKCQFAMSEIHYLGHIVTRQGLRVDPAKTQAMKEYPRPRTIRELRSFVGLASYYRRFIKGFATTAAPLTVQMGNRDPRALAKWDAPEEEAFQAIRNSLVAAPVLAHPDWKKEFILNTDASDVGLGAVLSQKAERGRGEVAISYLSRALTKAEQKWRVHEREALAIVWACEVFRPFLMHSRFQVRCETDHSNLRFMFNAQTPPRLARWGVRMAEFDYKVVYKKGLLNKAADALSRVPYSEGRQADGTPSAQVEETVPPTVKTDKSAAILACLQEQPAEEARVNVLWSATVRTPEEWKQAQAEDKLCQETLRKLQDTDEVPGPTTNKRQKDFRGSYVLDANGLLRFRAEQMKFTELRALPVVVPTSKITEILKMFHCEPYMGHLSAKKMLKKIQPRFYWPKMHGQLKRFCRSCPGCVFYKSEAPRNQGVLQPFVATEPFSVVHCDFIGPIQTTTSGNKYICVFVDKFTRWVECVATKDCAAETAADALIEAVVTRHGCPEKLITDRGSCYIAKMYERLLTRLGVHHVRVTAYNPQANAQVERVNKVLKAMLATSSKCISEWDRHLQAVCFAYRTSFIEQIQSTPFEMVYGRRARLPTDVLFGPQVKGEEDISSYRLRQAGELRATWQRARAAQYLQKDLMERRSKRRDVQFDPDDMVMLWIGSVQAGEGRRFGDRRVKGPYRVLGKLSPNTYRLERFKGDRREEFTAHVNHLIPSSAWDESRESPRAASSAPRQSEKKSEKHVRAEVIDLSSKGTRLGNIPKADEKEQARRHSEKNPPTEQKIPTRRPEREPTTPIPPTLLLTKYSPERRKLLNADRQVQKVLEVRPDRHHGRSRFQIEWKDGELTWEYERDLPAAAAPLLERFLQRT